ncbi:RibD family protein [Pedococcus sp. KACC 23699]|uniref:RibD family protein n=1 Tax=Pedococcus sp. KACC 23699 TaxID=3149228 RepID=A0AAU7JRZ6_9MICO
MADRPYTLLSCCMSLDGYLGSASGGRLQLSNAADFDRVDGERAASDAILVGAATIRNDNPRLLVRSAGRRAERVARGHSPSPVKVTVTGGGDLDPGAEFFVTGDVQKLVFCSRDALAATRDRLGGVATVLGAGVARDSVDLRHVGEELGARGIGRLMVEGGGRVHTQFLSEGLADELQLVVAPFFVGDACAPRFVDEGTFPWTVARRATLAQVQQVDDVALLRYALSPRYGEG